jgi:hypothetical protein
MQVVLSVRDPKSWYKSVTDSIYQFHTLIQTSWTIPLLMSMLDRRKGAGRLRNLPKVYWLKASVSRDF